MKKFTLLFFLLAIITICNAQSKFGWAKSFTSVGSVTPLATAVDATGNVYTAGQFSDEADFDPASTIPATFTAVGDDDVFITKHDATGNLLWVKAIGNEKADKLAGMGMDASGNLYLSGYFEGKVDFDPGPDDHSITSAGLPNHSNVFILKLDSDGEYVWAKCFAGENCESRSMAVDAAGNVYTTGYFTGVNDFDPGAGVENLASLNNAGVFVSKLNAAGDNVWVKGITGTEGLVITVDPLGNVYTGGYFNGTVDFDPGTGETALTSSNSGLRSDAFYFKLDAAGEFVWAKQISGDAYNPMPYSITTDASGALYVSGWFQGTVDFDPDDASTQPLQSTGGSEDAFILKLNAAGNYEWATRIGDNGSDFGAGISVDALGNVYATGYFTGTVDVDPGAGTHFLSSAGTDIDAYLVKLTANGDYSWATRFGGTSDDIGTAITVTGLDNIYLTGIFQETIDLDPGAANQDFTAPAGESGAFIVQLPPFSPLALTLLNFEAVDNNTTVQLKWQTTKEENMAGFTIERSANGKQFEAIGSVAVNNSFTLVNNYAFTDARPLNTTSYYRLKINELKGPAAYSRTIPVKRQGKANTLQVSPNPATNVLYVQIDAQEAITLQITDVAGHVVFRQSKTINGNTTFPVSIEALPAGNYYLILKGKTIQRTQAFLKR